VLHSDDARKNLQNQWTFNNVSIPFEKIKGNCRLFVSNFHFAGSIIPAGAFNINLEELPQQLSYDSRTGTTTKTIYSGSQFLENGNSDYGVSFQDSSLFVQRTLTFTFESLNRIDNTDLYVLNDDSQMPKWQLTLGVIQTE
jgi:hypothetical protein